MLVGQQLFLQKTTRKHALEKMHKLSKTGRLLLKEEFADFCWISRVASRVIAEKEK
jgi:hypothetical protein